MSQNLREKRLRDLIAENSKQQKSLNLASYETELDKIKFKKGYITVKSDFRDKILLLSHEINRNRRSPLARPFKKKLEPRHRFSYSVTDMSPATFASEDKASL